MSLLDKLIEQAKNPSGTVGTLLISIMNSAHSRMVDWALPKLKIKSDALILDIGCGGGNTIKTLAQTIKDGKIYGIDYSQTSVEKSIKTNQKAVATGKVIISKASVSAIPFADNLFDTITAFQTHYFWPDFKNDVKEVYRVLKPNGSFMIASEIYKINYHMKQYKSTFELEQLFRETGFCNVELYENKGWICVIGTK